MELFAWWNLFLITVISLSLCSLLIIVCFKKELFIKARGLSIFISGCDTGIGKRLAIYFDSLGCHVYAGCLNPISARQSLPESVTVVPLDICDEDSVKKAVDLVKNDLTAHGKGQLFLFYYYFMCMYIFKKRNLFPRE